MNYKFLLFLTLLIQVSCVDESRSKEILINSGFSNIEFHGYDLFGCSEDDVFKTAFTARSFNGSYVDGVVCCGYLKKCTIRY